MTQDPELANRLKFAREQAGYATAADAARAMRLRYPTYAGHENAHRGMGHKSISKYANFFHVNLRWLAENKGPMKGSYVDPLDGLPSPARQEALDYIEFLRAKYSV